MSRSARLLVIVAAWVAPAVWIATASFSGPSDGTRISPPTVLVAADPWGDTVRVDRVYGTSTLRPGDLVLAVEGRTWGDWLARSGATDVTAGDVLVYEIRRPDADLDLDLTVAVGLTRFPLLDALLADPALPVLAVLGLGVGSALFWRRSGDPPVRALLAGAALLACGLTVHPLSPGAVDVAGGRGLAPSVVGGVAVVAGLACLVVVAVTLAGSVHPRWTWVAVATPVVAYAAWALGVLATGPVGGYRVQALTTMVGPALVGAALAIAAVLGATMITATRRTDRLAARLLLLVLAGALGVWVLLDVVPQLVVGRPLVPGVVLVVVVGATVMGCVAAALARYRLDTVEPAVRRTLLQALVVAVVGGAFLAGAGAVGRASQSSFESLLIGGLIALLVLPLAIGAQRFAGRVLYGDRDLPRQVVAELRRLDPTSAPEEALRETLALLADRLRLSYAAIEVTEGPTASVGERQGEPSVVELVAGGNRLGRLLLETSPERSPFGAGDGRLLEDVGAEVGTLVQAVVMSTELQRSRQRLITAREEERRRLRRDLHDGLGPSLATMAMRLDDAHALIPEEPDVAADLVERLSESARNDIHEIRRLVDGLRPPTLDQLGLVSALRHRADDHEVGVVPGRPHLGWTVRADDDLEPLPAAVEVAAFRIAVEAVNNAVRHSGGGHCVVDLQRSDRVLRLRVRDDGAGLAAEPGVGVGLSSMRERAEELGGTLTISSDGTGTSVEARLPIEEADDR